MNNMAKSKEFHVTCWQCSILSVFCYDNFISMACAKGIKNNTFNGQNKFINIIASEGGVEGGEGT